MTEEQLKELIINKAPKFYTEFIKKGIKIYRGARSDSEVGILKTPPTRNTKGNIIPNYVSEIFEYIFDEAGVSSRLRHTVFTISGDYKGIKIPVDNIFWCIPIGEDYTYSYLKNITSDFNFIKDREILYAASALKITKSILKKEVDELLIQLYSSPLSEFETNMNKIFELLIKHVENPESFFDMNDYEEYVRDAPEELIELHPENFKKRFINNDNTTLENDVVSEVWFNCKSYILININDYDLTEIFKDYYQ